MRHRVRKLTLKEKLFLSKQGYDAKYFLRLSKDAESYTFVETRTGKILDIRR